MKKKIFLLISFIFIFLFSSNIIQGLNQELNSYFYVKPDYNVIDIDDEINIIVGLYDGGSECAEVQGFSLVLCHNSDLLEIDSAESILDGDIDNDFVKMGVYEQGVTYGYVWPFFGVCRSVGVKDALLLKYKGISTGVANLQFCEGLGDPPLNSVLVVEGVSVSPENNINGKIIIGDVDDDGLVKEDNCPEKYNPKQEDIDKDGIGDACDSFIEAPFVRGDANDDAKVDMADTMFILNYLFRDGKEPECLDAADANDDGQVNISDAVYLLNYLFGRGGAIPEPFTEVEADPTEDTLECRRYR